MNIAAEKSPHRIHSIRPMKGVVRIPPPFEGALIYSILQALASLESGHFARGDLDRFTGARIASGARSTRLDYECAEAQQRD